MKNKLIAVLVLACLTTAATFVTRADDATNETDKELAADLALLQGTWELLHGNQGKNPPNTRSVKTITGNTETLRRYSIDTGKLKHEHSVEFELGKSGSVRVFTFFAPGGSPENGLSYVYKVDKNTFFDIPGLLHGDRYHNYLPKPQVWQWKRVVENDTANSSTENESRRLE